jgi:hypothetical protein
MDVIRYFFWPAAFLLVLVFVGTPNSANQEDMPLVLHQDKQDMPGAASANLLAPTSIHAASPDRAPRRSSPKTAEEKI